MTKRTDGLSRELIVRAATGILDSGGERALTFRSLTTALSTGYGAIYHHVENKSDLLAAATDEIVAGVLGGVVTDAEPAAALRTVALGLFDAIDAHPWVGAQLHREPWRPAVLEVYERVGSLLDALGVPQRALFDAASALVNYVLGIAGQNAANARMAVHRGSDRAAFLDSLATQWENLDPARYPFVRTAAAQLRAHDDREQFLAGIDIFLAGIAGLR